MPAIDPEDQRAARSIETALRDAINCYERPPIELEWFMALPKRTRRSAQLIEAALAESRVLLEHVRAEWTRSRQTEQEREERLARAKEQPRDLECLRSPNPAAWNGLGRRKKRCRAFETVGRAYRTRQQLAPPAPTAQETPCDVHLLHPSSCHVPKRSPTPPGLRESVRNVPSLVYVANGPADATQYGFPTPNPPSPPPPPRVIRRVPDPVPPPEPQVQYEGETEVDGQLVDWRIAYLIARGRWESCRWVKPSSLRQTAKEVLDTEYLQPGMLSSLMEIFFPHGMDDWSLARPKLIYLRDFVLGWYAVAP